MALLYKLINALKKPGVTDWDLVLYRIRVYSYGNFISIPLLLPLGWQSFPTIPDNDQAWSK